MTAFTETTESTPLEVKALVEELHRRFEEFKETHDAAALEERLKGHADRLLEEKMERLSREMSRIEREIRALAAAPQRPGLDGTAARGPQDAEYKRAFLDGYVRRGLERPLKELEAKALSTGVPAEGGYAVPEEIDRRIAALARELSPIRAHATVVQVGSGDFRKLVAIGAPASGWVSETAARIETATPQFAEVAPPIGEIYANPAATQTMLDDSFFDVEAWLAGELAREFSAKEGAAFVAGDGVDKPQGLLSYPTSAADDASRPFGTIQHLATGVDGGFPASDPADLLVDLVYSLKAGYRTNARFLMNAATLARVRKFKDADGDYLWKPGLEAGQPSTLMGFPVVEVPDMPDIGPGALAIAFGNLAEAYLVADRFGTRVLRDPYSNKPFVHFYATKRVGGALVNSEAVKFIKFALS
ncbi:MAG: phage capsid protein [Rhodothalassiaceae bacterium]|nr:MAG: phage capsid protein [Rhodothalassiaceae bacterium]